MNDLHFRPSDDLNLKIKEHCDKKGITITDFLKSASENYLSSDLNNSDISLRSIFVLAYMNFKASADNLKISDKIIQDYKAQAEQQYEIVLNKTIRQ